MKRNQIKIIFFSLILLAVVPFFSSTFAYVLSGPHLLELMVEKYGKAERLLVYQQLVIYGNSNGGQAIELDETLRYIFPEQFRSDISTKNTQRIRLISWGETLTVIDGKVSANPEARFDRYKDILLFRSRKLLQQRLAILGVDITVSSLGRFEGKTVFIIGARYPDESKPQLFLDKDTFMPVRWIITGRPVGDNEGFTEIRYLDWKQTGKIWYPACIEFYLDEILMRKINAEGIVVNPSFANDLFDLANLKSIYLPSDNNQPESHNLNEIQKTMDKFKKIFE